MFVCTPAAANLDLLRACAKKGVRAAFIASAGYGEAGDGGPARCRTSWSRWPTSSACSSPGPTARASSPPRLSCARRSWRPTRRPGRIGIASQSGNFVSSFMNYAVQTGVGVSRAVSRRQRRRGHRPRLPRLLRRRPTPPTSASPTSRACPTAAPSSSALRPVAGAQAARAREGRRHRRRAAGRRQPHRLASPATTASSTAMCRQAGIIRAATIEEAYEAAATFATQPLPTGQPRRRADDRRRAGASSPPTPSRRTVARARCRCPTTCAAALDEKLPPRWSRNNPVDLAGGETTDTIPEVLELDRSATPTSTRVVFLGHGHPVRTRPRSMRERAASTPTTASSGSSTTTSARTRRFAPGRRRASPTATASRSSPPPSWPSPTPTTPVRSPVRASGRALLRRRPTGP